MPSRLSAPVLSLDAGKIHEIDPSNACSLMAMWSIFAKCSESLKDGPRLENMSWRVWSRESLCVAGVDSPPARSSQVPSLSNSYSSDDSMSDKVSCRGNSRSRSFGGHDDNANSLSKSRHLTPSVLEKIVVTIQEKTELCPLSPSIEASLEALPTTSQPQPQPQPQAVPNAEPTVEAESKRLRDSTDSCISNTTTVTTASTAHQSQHRDSDTSVSSDGLARSQSIVHGFSPAATSSFRKSSVGVQPTPPSRLVPKGKAPIKPAMFTLGGSSEDDESSFEQRVLAQRLAPQPQKSSLSQSLSKQNLADAPRAQMQPQQPKRTSFRDIIAARRIQEDAENDEGAIASSDEEEDTDEAIESAIDEDEDGDEWEDSNSDDGRAAPEPNLFRRVESRPDLVSRRSMLTLALNKGQGAMNYAYSQPVLHRPGVTSPKGKSAAGSPEEDDGMMMQTSKRPPIAISPPKASAKAVAHSPRTTRRNMLATELTESLRKNLLWERQQKSQTANAFLKRSRNAQSMANLQRHANSAAGPSQPPPPQETSKNNSWNHYFDNPWEYHAKGW
ncbi:hypothetical protein HRR83_004937 [Exophiala dermatitidis]|uniref:Uncharacterized protein n=2 Tax=Exophiala dermatitidis TaxID=5970 RepID=H6C3I8_EXODN|nr:uncharacterized protein HMPREF1120_06215 [Exophiala dermatitidis NIH/UT8656]KAJ4513898.1 hypothetical protein HRR75_004479 [Exophiala dermatitidis]EHY58203.1 hypothetical protein HMPREF1120_06215 [Exophiala dermatitidis NIH/UT8656]KAJ4517148.1 hypothetical protein HRR74_004898 [Exophiala dermatitidis]KAJ4519674.1 hypothetical protein HRR73_003734 [Exophiala dermatitidis]KAJ4534526.1 hypothetical protein HRR76_006448 [Exophiala dermatitidis]